MENPISLVADILSILGAIFALFAWIQSRQLKQAYEQEQARQNKKVTVILQSGANKRVELPVELRRAELTRAEILGRIGMMPMKRKGERFSISYLNTPEFLKQLNQVMGHEGDTMFIIPCTPEEIDQFDVTGSTK